MRVMLPYWTNSGNRSWTVTVNSNLQRFNYNSEDDCQSCNRNVANKVLLLTVTVQDLLPELDPNKSMGADDIGPKVLKRCALAIYEPLHHLFNLSLSQQVIPTECKYHAISPIHKSGNRSLVTN